MKEQDLISPLVNGLNLLPGVWAMRVNSGKVRVRGGWIQLAPPGFPDVFCCVHGQTFLFEIKAPGAKPQRHEDNQRKVQEKLRKAGAFVSQVDDPRVAIREVVEFLRTIGERK